MALSEIANNNFRVQVHDFPAQQVPQRRDRRGSLCGFPLVHRPRPADGAPHCMPGAPSGRASAVSACGPTGETCFDRTLRNRRGAHGLGIPQIHAFSSLGDPDIARFILCEANVLLHAFRSDAEDHPRHKTWVESLLNGPAADRRGT